MSAINVLSFVPAIVLGIIVYSVASRLGLSYGVLTVVFVIAVGVIGLSNDNRRKAKRMQEYRSMNTSEWALKRFGWWLVGIVADGIALGTIYGPYKLIFS